MHSLAVRNILCSCIHCSIFCPFDGYSYYMVQEGIGKTSLQYLKMSDPWNICHGKFFKSASTLFFTPSLIYSCYCQRVFLHFHNLCLFWVVGCQYSFLLCKLKPWTYSYIPCAKRKVVTYSVWLFSVLLLQPD
jgi:hypothetical protein